MQSSLRVQELKHIKSNRPRRPMPYPLGKKKYMHLAIKNMENKVKNK